MKKNVLIVDDNKEFVEGLQMILSTFYDEFIERLFIAYNGNDCLDIINDYKIDLVFMDYEMPGLNGAQVTKIAVNNNRYIKIIGLSYHSDMTHIRSMLESGARDYIVKDKITQYSLAKYFK